MPEDNDEKESKPDKYTEEEFAWHMAKKLAQEQRSIVGQIQSLSGEVNIRGLSIQRANPTNEEGDIAIFAHLDQIRREGKSPYGNFSFYFKGKGNADYSSFVNVQTPFRFAINGLYTDDETRQKFLEYSEAFPGRAHPTVEYFFSEAGEYGKLQLVNNDFNHGKPKIWKEEVRINGFVSPMTPGDFEIASAALGLLKEKIDGFLNQ